MGQDNNIDIKRGLAGSRRSFGGRLTASLAAAMFFAFAAAPPSMAAGIATLYTNEYSYNRPDSGVGNGNGSGQNGNGQNGNGIAYPVVIKSIAILPLENLTDNKFASDVIKGNIKEEFKRKGLVFIADEDSVERFLAKRRIRYTGAMTRVSVREMGKVLGVDAVLVGSVNYFSSIGGRLVVGVSSRLLSTLDGSIIWADNMTYTGHDFEGLLGLGIVRSIDVLAAMVVKDLVKGIEDRFFIRESAFSPFEIERVTTHPTIGSAKGKRGIRVEFLPLADEPEKVVAVIGGEEVILTKVRNNEYEAEVYAPEGEGTYIVDVVAMNRSSIPFPFIAVGKLVVDNTPPEVSLTVDKKLFSYSKKGGHIIFEPRLHNFDEIDEWKVEILDRDGNTVRSDKGFGGIPERMIWRGESDDSAYVRDGFYTLQLTVKDIAGNATVVSDEVMVKSKPPDIRVNVDVVDRIVLFTFDYNPDEPIENWLFAIKDRDGNTVKLAQGEGAGIPETFEYPLEGNPDLRELVFDAVVEDKAGNVFTLKKTIPSLFTRKIPLADLMGKDRLWRDF